MSNLSVQKEIALYNGAWELKIGSLKFYANFHCEWHKGMFGPESDCMNSRLVTYCTLSAYFDDGGYYITNGIATFNPSDRDNPISACAIALRRAAYELFVLRAMQAAGKAGGFPDLESAKLAAQILIREFISMLKEKEYFGGNNEQ